MACDAPVFIKLERPRYSGNQPIYSVNVACGKCGPCLKRRVNQWAFRLMQEDRRSTSCFFITLTYDNEHVPITPRCNMTLKKKDLQDFFKRLRYYHDKDAILISEIRNSRKTRKPIRYYAVGEYGGLFGRPHYHAIIFNCIPSCINDAWSFGNIQYREADSASIFYTLKYINKKESKQWSYDPDIVPEFSLKSKGLGDNYITPESLRHHSSDLDNNYVNSGKHKIALPRYYNKKFWPDSKDEYGRTIPHPHKTALLSHIKKAVQDSTDKQRKLDGPLADKMDIIRKNARFSKINGLNNRKF